MKKGAIALLIGVMFLGLGALNASASQRIEQISPFGGQFFQAKASQRNTAQVRVKFYCPTYETANGSEIDYRNYFVTFERSGGSFASFKRAAQRDRAGRCFVQYRFSPGTWIWQVQVNRDDSRSPKLAFVVGSDEPVGPYTLTRAYANRYMRISLSRKFGGNWQAGLSRRTKCVHRIGRDKFRCSPISWYVGELSFRGRGRVWFTYTNETAYWNVAFRIRKVNTYCLSRGGSYAVCSRTIVAR